MMQFHYFPSSHWSRVVHLVLREKGLDVEPHFVDLRNNENFEPEYMQLNPRGVVPTVVIDAEPVWNSPRIVETLDRLGGPPVLCSETSFWVARLVHFPVMYLSYRIWVLGQKGERSAEILKDKVARGGVYAERYPEHRDLYLRKQRFFARFTEELANPTSRGQIDTDCRATLDELASRVADREFIGAEWGFADAMATSILWRLADLPLLDDWQVPGHPLDSYFERMKARPSFQYVWFEDPLLGR